MNKTINWLKKPATTFEEIVEQLNNYENTRGYAGGEYLVFVKYKYEWEKEYESSLEHVTHSFGCDEVWEFTNDWRSSNMNAEYLAFIDVHAMAEVLKNSEKM